MYNWHLIPWTLQYLAGGSAIIIISIVVFSRNKGSLAYQNFFTYGLCTATWVIMAFLHRNAPTAELSGLFLRIDIFFVTISYVLLPITILCIWRERKAYYWLASPSFIIGIYALFMAQFEIFWSNIGWSFKFAKVFGNVFYGTGLLYLLLFCGAFIVLTRRISSKTLAKKYILVFISYLVFAIGGIITTLLFQRYTNFPPFGGILTLIQFLLIAYAVSLKPDKITTPNSELKRPISELSRSYITFLNKFQAAIPGQELGESSYRFQDYIEDMGIEDIVVSKSGALVFEADKISEEIVREAPDSIISLIKENPWAVETTSDFVPILLRTYELLQSQSETRANDWTEQLLREHGGFLVKHDMLKNLPTKVHLPGILSKLKPGQVYLFKEDNPKKAFDMLKEAEPYGIESLCITKFSPERIKERYMIQKTSILWLTFEKTEDTITPKDVVGLTKAVSTFSAAPDGTIILLDCFDQIKLANGFERSLDLLKDLRALSRENNSILIFSMPPELFTRNELVTIEKELEEDITN